MAERTKDRDKQAREHAAELRRIPPSPGATASPQNPGEVPDQEAIPGYTNQRVPRSTDVRRPLTEDQTAQDIMNVYAADGEEAKNPARYEQATAAYEELRKAYPAQIPPDRPAPGHVLRQGDATGVLPAGDDPEPLPDAANAPSTAGD